LENIEFSPRPDNDYWNDPSDNAYPINLYYLGFFAAITIESDNVILDLNGHTLQMSKEFYLLQRICNLIEVKIFARQMPVTVTARRLHPHPC
jgi:hypothetical protein